MSSAASVVMMPVLGRGAIIGPATVSEADRSVEVVFTTGAAVERVDFETGRRFVETLSLEPAHVRLARLNNGAPLLDTHNAMSVREQLGSVVAGSAVLARGQGLARVRFSRRASAEPVWQDVRDGIIRNVSVGYRVHKYERTVVEGKPEIRHAVDWEPYEISMVPMPADAGAQVRAAARAANRCEIVPSAPTFQEALRSVPTANLIAMADALGAAQARRTHMELYDECLLNAIEASERTGGGALLQACRHGEPLPMQETIVHAAAARAGAEGLRLPARLVISWREVPPDAVIPDGSTSLLADGEVRVYLNVRLGPDRLREVADHELRHAADFAQGLRLPRLQSEQRAVDYQNRMACKRAAAGAPPWRP